MFSQANPSDLIRSRTSLTSTEDFKTVTQLPRGRPQGVGSTSTEDFAIGIQYPRGSPQGRQTPGYGKPKVEYLENKSVPGKPPSLTSPGPQTLPHKHVVRCGEGLRAPLGAGQAEEKVNLRPSAGKGKRVEWVFPHNIHTNLTIPMI